MSSQTSRDSGSNQLTVDTERAAIFLGDNDSIKDSYVNNSTYDPITLAVGTVMGRVGTTGVLVPFTSSASDGSQNVVGILQNEITLEDGESAKASVVVSGKVAADKLIFVLPGDSLDKVVSSVRVRDKIMRESMGILLVSSTELSGYDN